VSGLKFANPMYDDLANNLLADRSVESCAIVYANCDARTGTWVAHAAMVVPESAYERRDAISAVLRPAYLVEVANRARPAGESVVLVHTHPMQKGFPCFSSVDDDGEIALAEYFRRRVPNGAHLALVISPDGCRARHLGQTTEIPVWEVGERLVSRSSSTFPDAAEARHDRQVRAFGSAGQRIIGSLRLGVVGLGGTGSVLVQQLAHLGVSDFTLVDPDVVEATNLNRLALAGIGDVGQPKTAVAERGILAVAPAARVRRMERDIVDADVAAELLGLDFIFLCTDSHASRAVVGQLAYQHLIPTIDMGVSITVRDGAVTHITGRSQMLSPGLPCLTCTGALDGEQIRREMLTYEQQAADPYILGAREPQPAVMSINSTMASLAVTMFLGVVTAIPANARFQLYDGIRGTVRPTSARIVPDCLVCSHGGALAKGSSWPLPVRPVPRHG
jgi:molybdopterin/thiamine biosynthesis adenylyltransferase